MADLKVRSVSDYTYLGCYKDSSSHVLSATWTVPINNEPQYCCKWCANVDTANTICGVEYGGQCYCDSTMPGVDSASASDCNSRCPGDGSAACGGEWRLGIYSATAPIITTMASSETLTPRPLQLHSYHGCYTDSSDRMLRGTDTTFALNDPAFCCEWCQNVDNNYKWCGVENGSQCFCDSSTFDPNSASAKDCSSSCLGAADQQCGGYWRLNLYKATGVPQADTTTTFIKATGASAIPSETNTSVPQTSQKEGLSGGSIAGIVVGAVAAVALLIAVVLLLARRRRSQTIPSYTTEGGVETPAAAKFTQANVHELQTPIQSPRAELDGSKSEPTLHEMDAGPR